MQPDEFMQLVTQGAEEGALLELRRDSGLSVARNTQGVSVVCVAVYRRQSKLAAALAAGRSDLDIFEASCVGDLGRVRQVVAEEPGCVNAVSPDGFSPVGYSAFFGHPDVLRELILRGGEVNVASRNAMRVCPLHSAAASSDPVKAVELARIVLEADADPNARQQGGFVPLHEAALNGNLELIALLLRHGADPKLQNEKGASAIDLARSKGHTEAAQMLERGAG